MNCIFWFRRDLRLSDNPALSAAAKYGSILPIFIADGATFNRGQASRWWLHNSLAQLHKDLEGNLHFFKGEALEVISALIKTHNISKVFFNRVYEPSLASADEKLIELLQAQNVEVESYNASLLWEPEEERESFYKVFTHFYRQRCLKLPAPRNPMPKPAELKFIQPQVETTPLEQLGLLPNIKWYTKFSGVWNIGEQAAQRKLQYFVRNKVSGYKEQRNYPAMNHTSMLSPHLHFGEVSPNQVWYAAQHAGLINSNIVGDVDHFLSELGWREFSYYVLIHFPELETQNFQSKFNNFPWSNNQEHLLKWQKGRTGYPIIDAGMRELWQTGYMHNRLRMIVGSFLIKNLLIDWREGQKWFADCLVDADPANNSASWQWVAGCGFDAAPYFRIFNPVLQAEKFDPDGDYIKKFIPELTKLPVPFLFKPWEAPQEVLEEADVVLGSSYPKPIVDLASSRQKALQIFHNLA